MTARRGRDPASLNSIRTRSVTPPCLAPFNVAIAAETTSYGDAEAEAAHLAVKVETFSS